MSSSDHDFLLMAEGASDLNEPLTANSIRTNRELFDLDKEKLKTHPLYHQYWVEGRKTTIPYGIFNIVGTIIGGGVLSLPYALAKSGLVTFLVLLAFSAAVTDWSIYILISCSRRTGAKSYKELAEISIGPFVGLLINFCLTALTFLVLIAYGILVRDLIPPILEVMGAIDKADMGTKNIVMICSLSLVLPLCFMKSLQALWFTSAFSLFSVGILVICLIVKVGQFYNGDHSFDGGNMKMLPESMSECLYIFPILTGSFSCHFNVLPVYCDLIEPSRERIKKMVHISIGTSAFMYFLCSFIGYILFFSKTEGNIFNNFSFEDPVMTIGRIGMGITILLSYPLMVLPCRENITELAVSIRNSFKSNDEPLVLSEKQESLVRYVLVILIVPLAVFISSSIETVVVVWNIIGSTVAIVVMFILPPLFYLKIRKPDFQSSMTLPSWFLLVFGVISLVLCSYETMKSF